MPLSISYRDGIDKKVKKMNNTFNLTVRDAKSIDPKRIPAIFSQIEGLPEFQKAPVQARNGVTREFGEFLPVGDEKASETKTEQVSLPKLRLEPEAKIRYNTIVKNPNAVLSDSGSMTDLSDYSEGFYSDETENHRIEREILKTRKMAVRERRRDALIRKHFAGGRSIDFDN